MHVPVLRRWRVFTEIAVSACDDRDRATGQFIPATAPQPASESLAVIPARSRKQPKLKRRFADLAFWLNDCVNYGQTNTFNIPSDPAMNRTMIRSARAGPHESRQHVDGLARRRRRDSDGNTMCACTRSDRSGCSEYCA
jgi:hypothetical protein